MYYTSACCRKEGIHLKEAVLRILGTEGGVEVEQEAFLYPWESEGCAGSGSGVTD